MTITAAIQGIGVRWAAPIAVHQDDPTPAGRAVQSRTGHDTRLNLVAVAAIAIIVLLIALGAMLGKLLADSGGARTG